MYRHCICRTLNAFESLRKFYGYDSLLELEDSLTRRDVRHVE